MHSERSAVTNKSTGRQTVVITMCNCRRTNSSLSINTSCTPDMQCGRVRRLPACMVCDDRAIGSAMDIVWEHLRKWLRYLVDKAGVRPSVWVVLFSVDLCIESLKLAVTLTVRFRVGHWGFGRRRWKPRYIKLYFIPVVNHRSIGLLWEG